MFKFPSWIRSRRLIFGLLVVLSLILTLTISTLYRENNTLHLALLAPTSGLYKAAGQEMVQATQMYLEEINQNGGLNGKTVKLEVFDDRGDVKIGKSKAQRIAKDSQILLALGSYFSSTSIAAGKIYQEAGLPAITATATAGDVTKTNDVYFRILLPNEKQGILMANYVKKVLQQDRVSLIFDSNNPYSKSVTAAFEQTFRGLGGQVKYKEKLNHDSPQVDRQVDAILKDFSQSPPEDIGTILLMTLELESAKFIVEMRRQGFSYPIFGNESLKGQTFLGSIEQYPEEIAQPGYFTDGIYVTLPLNYDVAGEATQEFRDRYLEKYQQAPTWIGPLSYDTAKVAVEALNRAGVTGDPQRVMEERQEVLAELLHIRDLDRAVEGLDGPLYFDRDRNVQRAIAVGVFEHQKLVSAPVQIQPIPDLQTVVDLEAELKAGNILRVGGDYAYVTRIAYAGIDINEISEFDLKEETYLVDFFLWFRYREDVARSDIQNIEFLNAVERIELGLPIYEQNREGLITQTFHIKGKFKTNLNFRAYPFDMQTLRIKFRNVSIPRERLIYVPDTIGMKKDRFMAINQSFNRSDEMLEFMPLWKLRSARFFESINKNYSSLGNRQLVALNSGINYSQFNAAIVVERISRSFIINNLFPLVFFVLILYLLLFLPLDRFQESAVQALMIGVVFFHIGLKSQLPGVDYIVALDVIFYVIYGLIVLQLLLIIAVSNLKSHQKFSLVIKRFAQTFRVVFILYLILAGLAIAWRYDLISFATVADRSTTLTPEAIAPELQPDTASDRIELTLGTWKPEYTEQIPTLFAAFEKQHPNIRLKHISVPFVQYKNSLSAQLQKDIAPDLIFLEGYSAHRQFFEEGYLKTLNTIPGLTDSYSAQALEPWITEKGEIYGVPFGGVGHGIYYNVDLFEQLNLDIPQTWSELLEVAKILKNNGYIPFANSLSNGPYQLTEKIVEPMFGNFIGGREGRLAFERGDRCFNDPQIVAAFAAIRQLQPYLAPGDYNIYQTKQLFVNQKAAMFFSGSWDILTFKEANLPFSWNAIAVPPPEGKPGYTVFQPDFAVGLNANSKHQEAAKDFLQWLMTPEASKILVNELIGNFALHKESPEVVDTHLQAFLKFIEKRETDVRWTYPQLQSKNPTGRTLIGQVIVGVITGKMTPQAAANSLQQGLAEWYQPTQVCGNQETN